VLWCFRRKGQFWVQLGGHVDSQDKPVTAGAYREAREEGGITDTHLFGPMPSICTVTC
jgi:8-oxo-dGTP pyrophosphatase MutT (NUDIX family)